ncbi:unnamed protein product [Auanema sp. JU1783]|nr:unnamed protein product [Auanema sp. JU1783]
MRAMRFRDNGAIDKWNVPDMRIEKSYVRREDRPKTAATVRKAAHVLGTHSFGVNSLIRLTDDIELHGTGGDGHFNPYFAADKAHEIMCKIMEEDAVDALETNSQHPKPTYFLAKNDLHMY